MKPFHFKEFSVIQERSAMKVGTDGVLLGAWTDLSSKPDSILDIGTGTGLIALQLAQRCSAETIDALEIDNNAFEEAVENFENSAWGDRLYCYHTSLQEFASEIDEQYDLIISNPPFYNDTYKDLEEKRATARHTKELSYTDLLVSTAGLLSAKGSCAFIIPFKEESAFLRIAKNSGLLPQRITRVKGNAKTPAKRSLLQLSFYRSKPDISELTIETERHIYTDPYKELVKDFYLKM